MEHYSDISLSKIKTPPAEEPQIDITSLYKTSNASEDQTDGELNELGTINFFVGANNSGKSRFLRSLFYSSDFSFKTKKNIASIICEQILEWEATIQKQALLTMYLPHDSRVPKGLLPFLPGFNEVYQSLSTPYLNRSDYEKALNEIEGFKKFNNLGNINKLASDLTQHHYLSGNIALIIKAAYQSLSDLLTEHTSTLTYYTKLKRRHIYIPILRGLRCADQFDYYSDKVFNDYFNKKNIGGGIQNQLHPINKDIFNGLNIFEQLTTDILDSSSKRKLVLEYETFLSEHLFDGQKIEISPKRNTHTVHIRIGEKSDLPIYSLGDGLQSLIILTFDAFFAEQETLYCVEEPELYLHPGMQRQLINLISSHPKMNRHQWLCTTHSNHMLDITLDFDRISVFKFTPKDQVFDVKRVSSGDHNTLKTLGVQGSSVFRTNCIIWVEGITDRQYLKTYFNKYTQEKPNFKKFKEDTHYSFMEFAGSNLTHFDFSDLPTSEKINVKKIIDNSFLLLDGDNADKGTRLEDTKEIFSEDRFSILNQKEIENTLPEEAVKHCVIKRLEISTLLKEHSTSLIDNEVQKISKEKYSEPGTAIGKYIDITLKTGNLIQDEKGKPKKYFSTITGTISQKVNFCETAIAWMEENTDWSLDPEIEKLCEKIYGFISSANKV